MPIHVAITRRVRPGCEAEFQQALREFFQTSFGHGGMLGASMLTPPPGSDSREFGILRTFAGAAERKAFYESPLFKAWEQRAKALTEGEPEYRQLHGLEAWFRSPHGPPPRWKMATATFLGVFPTAAVLNLTLGRAIQPWPFILAVSFSMQRWSRCSLGSSCRWSRVHCTTGFIINVQTISKDEPQFITTRIHQGRRCGVGRNCRRMRYDSNSQSLRWILRSWLRLLCLLTPDK